MPSSPWGLLARPAGRRAQAPASRSQTTTIPRLIVTSQQQDPAPRQFQTSPAWLKPSRMGAGKKGIAVQPAPTIRSSKQCQERLPLERKARRFNSTVAAFAALTALALILSIRIPSLRWPSWSYFGPGANSLSFVALCNDSRDAVSLLQSIAIQSYDGLKAPLHVVVGLNASACDRFRAEIASNTSLVASQRLLLHCHQLEWDDSGADHDGSLHPSDFVSLRERILSHHHGRDTNRTGAAALDRTIVFLDGCERFRHGASLAAAMEVWRMAQNSGYEALFLGMESGFEYDAYSVAVMATKKHNDAEKGAKQWKDPPNTAMVVSERWWRRFTSAEGRASRSDAHRPSDAMMRASWEIAIARRTLKKTMKEEEDGLAKCADRREEFWVQMGLSGVRGVGVGMEILENAPARKAKSASECAVDVRHIRRHSPSLLPALSALKRNWAPAVSVIIPFYNVPSPDWFLETLASLYYQSFADFEIIIVDDGSAWWRCWGAWRLLQILEASVLEADGWWDGTLNGQPISFPSRLLRGKSPANTSYTSNTSNTWYQAIPLRVIRHTSNRGLAEARNSGVAAARGDHVFFLDPDDLLAPTALEKLALFARIQGRPDSRFPNRMRTFFYPGIVHLYKSSTKSESTADRWTELHDPVYWDFNARDLVTENRLTSAALISRAAFLHVGGMCPRSLGVKYFEDYEFWLRMVSYFGHSGKLLKEPLFFYRRHTLGESWRILQNSQKSGESSGTPPKWREELKRHNPVAFGEVSQWHAQQMVEARDWGDPALNNFMPCVRTFRLEEPDAVPEVRFWARADKRRGEYAATIGLASARQSDATSLFSRQRRAADIFPFNPRHQAVPSSSRSTQRRSFAYFIPWMVMGGADLYDLQVLSSMRGLGSAKPNSTIDVHTSLLVARHIEPHHPWEVSFFEKVDEIFYLQLMTNDTGAAMAELVDYLVESRFVDTVLNSRTIPGYDAVERWGLRRKEKSISRAHAAEDAAAAELFPGPALGALDILHLHHGPNDNTNWEHRSARCSKWLARRVVVSEDLKQHMAHVLGYGDDVLGVPNRAGRVALSAADAAKIAVIAPPVLVEDAAAAAGGGSPGELERTAASIEARCRGVPASARRPRILFVGRLDEQKHPELWVDVAKRASQLWSADESFPSGGGAAPAPEWVIIGDGPLRPQLERRLALHGGPSASSSSPSPPRAAALAPAVHDLGALPHAALVATVLSPRTRADRFAAGGSVTVLTSRREGSPIAAMESAAAGHPVVSMECGAVGDVLVGGRRRRRGWLGPVSRHSVPVAAAAAVGAEGGSLAAVEVRRSALASVVGVDCGAVGGDSALLRAAAVEAMAKEVVRFWREAGRDACGAAARRWVRGEAFRREFGGAAFREKWAALLREVAAGGGDGE
ncbi:hypothetical protein DFJ73DRAFT_962494 [Zopfochytrium polystomum]|nr:hypothetical protein DFJ73DRAFT_962494 [Zopfochytrium polystomum]